MEIALLIMHSFLVVFDIWLEDYISGNKTIVKCSNGTWSKEFFVADILAMCRSKEQAEQKLKEMRGGNG